MSEEIKSRYGTLSESNCCLSCGGAAELSGASEGEVCIDLGSGRGTDVLKLAGIVGQSGFVYGVDLTEQMIRKAETTAEKLGVSNVRFVRAELEAIPLPEATAHLIISNCTINHSGDKERVWQEVYRLLKPGGRFVVSDIYSETDVPEEFSKDPEAVAECWAGAITREKYLDILNKTGFNTIKILEESQPYDKGKIKVSSFTVSGYKPKPKCSCNCN